ncbi:hypothetical protein Fmac_032294 [Flemingia macrophylla]|uniref:Protein LURP-one-related 15 n=1 Tax=Flemingia macrophylla TaxID=520843 RepID=A0ABD1L4H1_9FABA
MAERISVINSSYCHPKSLNLQINTQKCAAYDEKGDLVFSLIKEEFFTLHHSRVLYDDKGNPIVTLYKKRGTLHGRWQIFLGKCRNSSQLLFSIKNSSNTDRMSRLDVFLANNTDESMCDFRLITFGNQVNSCTVYYRESPKVVAKIVNNMGFNVSIKPNVDSAFIVALIMIITEDLKGLRLMHTTGKVAGEVAGQVAIATLAGLATTELEDLLDLNPEGEEEGGGEEEEEGGEEGREEEGGGGEEQNVD